MHELWLASQVVDKIVGVAHDKKAKRVKRVELLLGELTMVGAQQFLFWIKELLGSSGQIAQSVEIELKPVKAVVECKNCGYRGGLKPIDENHLYPDFSCPCCDQPDIEVKKGRELILNKIQLEV